MQIVIDIPDNETFIGWYTHDDGVNKYHNAKTLGKPNYTLYGGWIPTSERLPNKSRWVLVTAESYQKPVEIMCYQGVRIGQHNVGNGWEEYEYPSWTSGHGDIQSHHPEAWMPLPEPYKH